MFKLLLATRRCKVKKPCAIFEYEMLTRNLATNAKWTIKFVRPALIDRQGACITAPCQDSPIVK